MSLVSIQVLCVESIDSISSLVITTTNHRIIVNCGESIQRLCIEHKVRLSKISAILITNFTPQSFLGLPGLCLTTADAGNSMIRICGPDKIQSFMRNTECFMRLPNKMLDFDHVYQTSDITIYTIPLDIQPKQSTIRMKERNHICYIGFTPMIQGKFDVQKAQLLNIPKGPLYSQLKEGRSITLSDSTIIHPNQVLGTPETSKCFIIICSIELSELENVLNNQLFIDFNVDIQSKYIHFQKQYSQHYPNNNTSESYKNDLRIECIYHLSSIETINTCLYQSWLNTLPSNIKHIMIEKSLCRNISSFHAITKQCQKLHLLSPDLFPPMNSIYYKDLKTNLSNQVSELILKNKNDNILKHLQILPGQPLLKYNLCPEKHIGIEYPMVIDIKSEAALLWKDACTSNNLIIPSIANAYLIKDKIKHYIHNKYSNNIPISMDVNNNKPSDNFDSLSNGSINLLNNHRNHKIWFLGTGCAIPSKYRNVSGILLQLNYQSDHDKDHIHYMLIDAGEGTWAQLLRMSFECDTNRDNHILNSNNIDRNNNNNEETIYYSMDIKWSIASRLKVIWISHPHADHHLGLIRIIIERKRILKSDEYNLLYYPNHHIVFQPLLIIAPPSVLLFLHSYGLLDSYIIDAYIPVSSRHYDPHDQCDSVDCYWNSRIISNKQNEEQPPTQRQEEELQEEKDVSSFHHSNNIDINEIDEEKRFQKVAKFENNSIQYSLNKQTEDDLLIINNNNIDINTQSKTYIENQSIFLNKSTSSSNQWRNYSSIFKESISKDIIELTLFNKQKADHVLNIIGIYSLKNIQVIHCGQSYGLCIECFHHLEHPTTFLSTNYISSHSNSVPNSTSSLSNIETNISSNRLKIVYSGDTRPCQQLVNIGMNATILIHEATFEDDKQMEAMNKKHSTISEALQISKEMNAYRTILTHFSQRYPSTPQLPSDLLNISNHISNITNKDINDNAIIPIIAFDYMHICFHDLLWLPYLTKSFVMAFPNENNINDQEDQIN